MEELSPQVRHQLVQFQQAQQQAQAIIAQRQQLEMLIKETEMALQELQKLPDDAVVYKSVGTILVRVNKQELQQSLTEEKEELDLRIKTLARQQERILERLEEMRQKLEEALKGQPKGGAAG
ncbi:MAG: prefoldin subunit beta [Candidatus Hadarchaeales archaeon]